MFPVSFAGIAHISLRCSVSQAVSLDFLKGFILQNVIAGKVFPRNYNFFKFGDMMALKVVDNPTNAVAGKE